MAPSKLSNDARKKLAANLQVLRRYDDQIDAIVDTTSHVVLYQFEESTQSWANKEVEGALFVYKRSSAPYYGFTILNRVGLENYTELLSADMSFQASDQIAIYTSKNGGGIVGIWIYEEADRVRIPEQLSMCCSSARSAVVGQGPRCLYPKNAEEEREFLRMYPRSRSNSRRDGANEAAGANSALSTIVNRTRQQQQKKQPQQPHSASKGGSANPNDLVSKLQAIGLDPSGGAGGQPQDVGANASALPLDPAIIMARKSVKPSETSPTAAGSMAASFQTQAQDQNQAQAQNQAYAAGGADGASAFRSPLPVPVPAVHGQGTNGASRANAPPSPVLHPAPSPFPPSTIATPLPGQALQGISPNAAYMAQMQQFWHPQMGNAPVPRSAHASPAPMAYAMHPAMHVFPQLVMGHPGAPHTPQPHVQNMQMAPVQLMPGMPMLPPQHQQHQQQPADSPEPAATSVAQNLAEQLVSLVRQRMTSVHPAGESGAAPTAEPAPVAQQAALPPSALKMQRDYCREWLIRVIRADDELVDAFAQRFPPPIFAQQNQ